MDSTEFSRLRRYLGKTQVQLARLLCISPKAVQSFEQGWRNVPVQVERQVLLLICLKQAQDGTSAPCWEIRNCPAEMREGCPAWDMKAGQLCWFINGTNCQGKSHESWTCKLELCRKCDVLRPALSVLGDNALP